MNGQMNASPYCVMKCYLRAMKTKALLNSITVCGLFILFIPTYCGYYYCEYQESVIMAFGRRNVGSWVDSTFDS